MVWFQNGNAMQRVANIYHMVYVSQCGRRAIYGNIYLRRYTSNIYGVMRYRGNIYGVMRYTGNIYGVMRYTGNIYGVMRYTGNMYDGVVSERECR